MNAVFPDDTLIRLRALARHHRVRRLELLGRAPGVLDVTIDFEFLVAFDGLPPSEHDRQYARPSGPPAVDPARPGDDLQCLTLEELETGRPEQESSSAGTCLGTGEKI